MLPPIRSPGGRRASDIFSRRRPPFISSNDGGDLCKLRAGNASHPCLFRLLRYTESFRQSSARSTRVNRRRRAMEPIENKGLERAVDQVRRAHGSEPIRGLQDVARSTLYEGRFGRMFRNLPPFLPPDQDLIALAGRMFEPAG